MGTANLRGRHWNELQDAARVMRTANCRESSCWSDRSSCSEMPISANLSVGFRAHDGQIRRRAIVPSMTIRVAGCHLKRNKSAAPRSRSFNTISNRPRDLCDGAVTLARRFNETSYRAPFTRLRPAHTRHYRQMAPGLINANPRISTTVLRRSTHS